MGKLLIAGAAALLMGQASPRPSVADLAWLEGRWATQANGRWTEENWAGPRAGVMLGHSRSGRGDALGEWEFLRVQADAEGVPTYYPQPGGQPSVAFRLVARDGTSATFENPQHDFPQRIRYVRNGETLTATISAIDGSNAMSWTYRRQ
jgi:hypothetical protein